MNGRPRLRQRHQYQAPLDARAAGSLAADIVLVVSNKPGVGALDRGRPGVATEVIPHERGHSPLREAFDGALVAALRARATSSWWCWRASCGC